MVAAFASTAALAQSSVDFSGFVLLNFETAKASGATAGSTANILPYSRVTDGNSSNIRLVVSEELSDGISAFIQVESSVLGNADNRPDAFGKGANTPQLGGANTTIWGNRNSGIGIRSQAVGRFLVGVWSDGHGDVHYASEGWGRTFSNPAASSMALTQNLGWGGAVYGQNIWSNIIRWDSPTWSGLRLVAAYARPNDGPPPNIPGDVRDGRKERLWNFAPTFESGALRIGYSYLQDKDLITNFPLSFAGLFLAGGATIPAAWKTTTNRLGVRYKLDNGLWVSGIWDSMTVSNTTYVKGGQVGIKRSVWSIPLSYAIGNHTISATYAMASNWSGSMGGADVHAIRSRGFNFGSDTGASFASFLYTYNLSQRTVVYASYQKIINQPLVAYDLNLIPAMPGGTGGSAFASYGADPRSISLGIRHMF